MENFDFSPKTQQSKNYEKSGCLEPSCPIKHHGPVPSWWSSAVNRGNRWPCCTMWDEIWVGSLTHRGEWGHEVPKLHLKRHQGSIYKSKFFMFWINFFEFCWKFQFSGVRLLDESQSFLWKAYTLCGGKKVDREFSSPRQIHRSPWADGSMNFCCYSYWACNAKVQRTQRPQTDLIR